MSAIAISPQPQAVRASNPTIALLGTGRMGEPIAHNLLTARFPVRVWNRTSTKTRQLGAAGAQICPTPAAAAARSDVLVTMLSDGAVTERAVAGPHGALTALARGAIWVQMGTIGLDWTETLSRQAWDRGVRYIDAPVSGSDGPARSGELMILASGDESLRDHLQPLFDAIGRRTLWLGPIGNGSAMKLALNAWLAALTETAAETVALSESVGLDPRVLVQTLADLPLASPYALAKATAMIDHQFEPGFALRHAHKDVALAVSAATKRGLTLPIVEQVDARWDAAIADGHGDQDVAVAIEMLRAGNVSRSPRPMSSGGGSDTRRTPAPA